VSWTPDAGGDNYSRVSDPWPNSFTTYVFAGSSGLIDIYQYEDITTTQHIEAVQVVTILNENAAWSLPIKVLSKSGSTTVKSDAISPGTMDWDGRSVIFTTNAEGSDWTETLVNAAKFGLETV
jgi:hypothetical protein